MQRLMDEAVAPETKEAMKGWIDVMSDGDASKEASEKVIALFEKENHPLIDELLALKQYFVKKSVWVFGGDGWAYDIGFGGLDHVIASGADINLLVMDTEVYSNTGGQSSKATPVGAVAKFAASGKKIRKKDLGAMAMTYGYVYVAQVAMGSNQTQTLKAFAEAEAYQGPSLVICYSPCINHGMNGGLTLSQTQEKKAVDCGYWHLYRFNPTIKAEGKNPFILDSKEPTGSFKDFLMSEVRYSSLLRKFPQERVDAIFDCAEAASKERLDSYKRMAVEMEA